MALGSQAYVSAPPSLPWQPHLDQLIAWVDQGVSGAAIHATLKRQHAWTGSCSSVRRLLADIRLSLPPETTCQLWPPI